MRTSRDALNQGLSFDEYIAGHERSVERWTKLFHAEMERCHATDPVEVLPALLAKLEERAIGEARRVAERIAKQTRERATAKDHRMTTENDRAIRYGISLSDPHAMEKYRADDARRKSESDDERQVVHDREQILALRAEIDGLRTELATLRDHVGDPAHVEAVGRVIGELNTTLRKELIKHVSDAIRAMNNKFLGLVEHRHGQVMGRLDALLGEPRSARKGIQVRERTDCGPQ